MGLEGYWGKGSLLRQKRANLLKNQVHPNFVVSTLGNENVRVAFAGCNRFEMHRPDGLLMPGTGASANPYGIRPLRGQTRALVRPFFAADFSSSTACAAANRAMGTRKGDALT